ncbi:MAG: hypothetical protein ACO3JL_21335, partial [Myxococcota bacterium]
LRICPLGGEVSACDVALLAGEAWPAGSNGSSTSPKRTMVRLDAENDGSVPQSWATYEGAASSVTDAAGGIIYGSPGVYAPAVPAPVDAGPDDGGAPSPPGRGEPPDDDAGSFPSDGGAADSGVVVADAGVSGPNQPPTLLVEAVVEDGQFVRISYVANDPDDGDAVAVDLFLDDDASGNDGVLLVAGLPGGVGEYRWSAVGIPAGDHYVFGRATDTRGTSVYAYAPASVRLSGNGASAIPSVVVLEPDGVNDLVNGKVRVRWRTSLPAGASGTISLGYDEDDENFDGQTIIAGLMASGEAEGPQEGEYLWDTADVPPGNYAVYAQLHFEGGQTGAYGGFVEVGAPVGCQQATVQGVYPLAALLALLWAVRRRTRMFRS